MAIIFEAWHEMNVRMRHADAAGISDNPIRLEHCLQRLCNSARLHKHKAQVCFFHVPHPPVMTFRDKLGMAGIKRITIEKAEILGVLINDLVRIRATHDITKHAVRRGLWHIRVRITGFGSNSFLSYVTVRVPILLTPISRDVPYAFPDTKEAVDNASASRPVLAIAVDDSIRTEDLPWCGSII